MEAQLSVRKVESNYEDYTDLEDVNLLQDYRIRQKILAKYTTDNEIRVYFGSQGAVAVSL